MRTQPAPTRSQVRAARALLERAERGLATSTPALERLARSDAAAASPSAAPGDDSRGGDEVRNNEFVHIVRQEHHMIERLIESAKRATHRENSE